MSRMSILLVGGPTNETGPSVPLKHCLGFDLWNGLMNVITQGRQSYHQEF